MNTNTFVADQGTKHKIIKLFLCMAFFHIIFLLKKDFQFPESTKEIKTQEETLLIIFLIYILIFLFLSFFLEMIISTFAGLFSL